MSEVTIKGLAIALFAGFFFFAGWSVEGWRKDAQIAAMNATQQQAKAAAASQAAGELQAAVLLGDALSARLVQSESRLSQLTEEKDHEIRRLTQGRRCLDSAVVRVLNDPASRASAAVPAATGDPVRADAPFATDTDVGLWATDARQRFDSCRTRLDAIADFYAKTPAYAVDGESR